MSTRALPGRRLQAAAAIGGLLAALAGLLVAPGTAVAAETEEAPSAKVTFEGSYDWNGGARDALEVTFAPDIEGGWEVSFRFRHGQRFRTWNGRAIGELDGALEGKVDRYHFAGRFEDGVFTGKHFERQSSGLRENGTLTFR